MAKIDVYLRSIERFGAAGAVLTSGQAVTLKFPQGDRNATQITPHDQLVALAREVAPPAALAQIDSNRPAKFDFASNGLPARPGRSTARAGPCRTGSTRSQNPAAGAEPRHLTRLTWYITNRDAYIAARKEIGGVWRELFGAYYPPMSVVIVAGLVEERALVEIEATAVLPA